MPNDTPAPWTVDSPILKGPPPEPHVFVLGFYIATEGVCGWWVDEGFRDRLSDDLKLSLRETFTHFLRGVK